MRRRFALLLAAAMLTACASTPTPAELTPAMAADALVGRWDTKAQFDAAPESLKKPPAAGHPYDWIDRQAATFARVEAPALGPAVVYLEWRSGGPEGPLSRQRLWSFRRDETGALRMDFFTLREPEKWAGAAPAAFHAITPADVIGYGPTCGLTVTPKGPSAWDARIEPQDCRITARQSGRTMGIAARVTLMPTGLLYEEAGLLDEETYAFKVPGGPPYDFRRAP